MPKPIIPPINNVKELCGVIHPSRNISVCVQFKISIEVDRCGCQNSHTEPSSMLEKFIDHIIPNY